MAVSEYNYGVIVRNADVGDVITNPPGAGSPYLDVTNETRRSVMWIVPGIYTPPEGEGASFATGDNAIFATGDNAIYGV